MGIPCKNFNDLTRRQQTRRVSGYNQYMQPGHALHLRQGRMRQMWRANSYRRALLWLGPSSTPPPPTPLLLKFSGPGPKRELGPDGHGVHSSMDLGLAEAVPGPDVQTEADCQADHRKIGSLTSIPLGTWPWELCDRLPQLP